jgi:hypothetical protein
MAQLLSPQAPRPREPDARSQAAPAVVCPLESSRAGQHAAAVAGFLSRGLGWRLALVPGGSAPLDPETLAASAVNEQAGLIVISAGPTDARAVAVRAHCPVVVAPAYWPPQRFDRGPLVCALDRTRESGRIASAATRFALQLGATVRFVDIGPRAPGVDLLALAKTMSATLLVVGADEQTAIAQLAREATDIPVMVIPSARADRPSHTRDQPVSERAASPCVPLPSAVVRGSLVNGLLICLGQLHRDPDCFEAAAVAWHARWCEQLPGARIPESRAVLSALEALGGADPSAGARALRDLCQEHQLRDLTAVLDDWLEGRRQPIAA